jgi:hypothetical protein
MRRYSRLKPLLPDVEFSFSQLDQSEIEVCRDYEMAREIALRDRTPFTDSPTRNLVVYPLLEDTVLAIRKNWAVMNPETMYSEQSPNWREMPASRVLVLYPEWPDSPYLQIPKRERRRRIRELFPEEDQSEDLDGKVTRIQRELRKLRKSERDSDVQRKADLQQELAGIASLIQPNWRGAKTVHNIRIAIPNSDSNRGRSVYMRDIEAASRALLLLNCPELPDHKGAGRSNEVVRDDLNSLAVLRLIRAGQKRSDIIDLVRVPSSDGSKSYSSPKKLDHPRRRLPIRLDEFYWQVLNSLEPLKPLNPSPPENRKTPGAEESLAMLEESRRNVLPPRGTWKKVYGPWKSPD